MATVEGLVPLALTPIPGYVDSPPSQGTWYYRVTSYYQVENQSEGSNQVAAVSDATGPTATIAIAHAMPLGPGLYALTLTASEPLPSEPVLTWKSNSGGPVFDLEGRVIGVVTRTHESGEGIAFAVPVRVLRWVLDSMQRNAGRVPRGYLGIRFQPLVPRDREQYAVAEGGALVVEVHPGQPADRAGIRPRDVILAFDGQPVRTAYDLHDWITQGPPGRQVQLDLSRGGSAIEPVTVTLAEPATHAADGEQPRPGKH